MFRELLLVFAFVWSEKFLSLPKFNNIACFEQKACYCMDVVSTRKKFATLYLNFFPSNCVFASKVADFVSHEQNEQEII